LQELIDKLDDQVPDSLTKLEAKIKEAQVLDVSSALLKPAQETVEKNQPVAIDEVA